MAVFIKNNNNQLVPVGASVKIGTLKKLLDATKSCKSLFDGYGGNNIADLITYSDTENVTNMDRMFANCLHLTSIPLLDTGKAITMGNMFRECTYLTSIPALDMSHISQQVSFGNIFYGCSSLETIHATGMKWNFDISASTQFTEAALVEIIGNLATVDSTKTLTMGATNLAKLTAEEIAVATAKGWTLA